MSEETSSMTTMTESVDTTQSIIGFEDAKEIQESTMAEATSPNEQTNEENITKVEETKTDINSLPTNTAEFEGVSNEIWSSITGQHGASFDDLHESIQLDNLNQSNNNTNNDGSNNDISNVIQQLEDATQQQTQQQQNESTQSAVTELATQPNNNEIQQIVDKDDKPAVGSPEWHKLRRENHKQVERRRRETINEGINEIARIVPGCEKNKGSILQRAAVYIRQLKEAEAATVEKWTLEKLLTDQAISELNRQVEVLKNELDRARLENSYLKRDLESSSHSLSKKQKLEDVE